MTGAGPPFGLESAGLRTILRGVVSAVLLAGLVWFLDGAQLLERLRGLKPTWVLVALALSIVQMGLLAWRWQYTARRLGIRIGFGEALREYYLATFLNQVLPGGVLGDVSRAWRHAAVRAGAGGERGPAVRAVILERASAQVVMTAAAVVSFLVLPVGWTTRWTVAGAAFVVGVVGAITMVRARRGRTAPATDTLAGRSWADTRTALLDGAALPVQLGSAGLVVGTYIATYLVAAVAIGVDTPLSTLLPLVAPVLLAMLVPVTIAGWGLREGAAALLWGMVGLTAADGVAISITYGLLILASSLPGAAMLLWLAARRSRSKSTSLPSRK